MNIYIRYSILKRNHTCLQTGVHFLSHTIFLCNLFIPPNSKVLPITPFCSSPLHTLRSCPYCVQCSYWYNSLSRRHTLSFLRLYFVQTSTHMCIVPHGLHLYHAKILKHIKLVHLVLPQTVIGSSSQ